MLTKWFNFGKEPPQAAIDKITDYLKRMDCPTYLGRISAEIGYSLDQTEAFLLTLQDRGTVRCLTLEEKRSRHLDVRGSLWLLVK